MYKGNYSSRNKNRKRRLRWHKEFVLLMSVVVLLVGVAGGSLAYLFTNSDPVTNTFLPAHVDSIPVESFSNNVKENIGAKNTSNIPAFLRATISYRWENEEGQILAQTPSVNITPPNGETCWFKVGEIYYYENVVPANKAVDTYFISSISVNGTAPEGYHLVVDVLTEAIQAEGVSEDGKHPVEIAWGVKYNAGTPATISENKEVK